MKCVNTFSQTFTFTLKTHVFNNNDDKKKYNCIKTEAKPYKQTNTLTNTSEIENETPHIFILRDKIKAKCLNASALNNNNKEQKKISKCN